MTADHRAAGPSASRIACDSSDVVIGRRQLELYGRHPWLLDVIQQSPGFGPEALAWMDHCLHVLEPVDCSTTAKFEAIAMMTGVTTLFARSARAPQSAFPSVDLDAYPHLTAAMTRPASSSPSSPSSPSPSSPSPSSPRRDLYEVTMRSLLTGLLV